jgi:STE24 endopeptidase
MSPCRAQVPRSLARLLVPLALWSCAATAALTGAALAQGSTAAPPPVTAPPPGALVDSVAADTTGADSVAALAPPRPDYLAQVHANFTPQNRNYQTIRVWLELLEPFYGILIGLLILFSGLAARMRDVAHAMGRHRYVRVLVFFILYTLVGFVLTFPLAWYRGYALEHQYGLSTQAFGGWLADALKGEAVGLFFFGVVPILALAYWCVERQPRAWWLWIAAVSLPLIAAGTLIQPLVIDPLFNRFTPLRDQQLKQKIVALAERAGIPGRRVYEVDMSTKSIKYNAYVTGFGASQRIVLWDTTLKGMKEDEILFVMAHEMGHYKLGHIWKGIAFFTLVSLVLFFLTWLIAGAAQARFGPRWEIPALHDVASLPMLAVILSALSLLALPAVNAFSRAIEHESDIYGVEITRDNDAAARAFLKLGSQNRSDPEPSALVRTWMYSHPPLGERIRFALEYRPWEQGRPNQLFHGLP